MLICKVDYPGIFVAVAVQAACIAGTSSSSILFEGIVWVYRAVPQCLVTHEISLWRRKKEQYSFYGFSFCLLHCPIITLWTQSWWVWLLRHPSHVCPIVYHSCQSLFPGFHSVLHVDSSCLCERLGALERESKAGAGLHALLMYCAVVFKGGLHVQMSDTQDRGGAPLFLCMFQYNSERILVTYFAEALLMPGLIIWTCLNTLFIFSNRIRDIGIL